MQDPSCENVSKYKLFNDVNSKPVCDEDCSSAAEELVGDAVYWPAIEAFGIQKAAVIELLRM